jgi:hypothetical protein
MSGTRHLETTVSPEMKARVHALAKQQFITEAAWLRQLVTETLRIPMPDETAASQSTPVVPATHRNDVLKADHDGAPGMRVEVHFRPEDRLLLKERAEARGMRSATYVSVLVRAHLRNLAPLPKDELIGLKRSVAELGAIGRSLNQLARAANSGHRVAGPTREDLLVMLKVCEAVRANVKELIRTNVKSWDVSYAKPESEP